MATTDWCLLLFCIRSLLLFCGHSASLLFKYFLIPVSSFSFPDFTISSFDFYSSNSIFEPAEQVDYRLRFGRVLMATMVIAVSLLLFLFARRHNRPARAYLRRQFYPLALGRQFFPLAFREFIFVPLLDPLRVM